MKIIEAMKQIKDLQRKLGTGALEGSMGNGCKDVSQRHSLRERPYESYVC